MKKAIKRIATVAMAFTLLGTGNAITKTIAPQADNTITASAACQYHKKNVYTTNKIVLKNDGYVYRHYTVYCSCCRKEVNQYSSAKLGNWYFCGDRPRTKMWRYFNDSQWHYVKY